MRVIGSLSTARFLFAAALLIVLGTLMLPTVTNADHESTTTAIFEPVEGSSSPNGRGDGLVEFHGGPEPESRWTATFQFTGLAAETLYVVMVQGRYGDDGSAEASAYTEICRFTSDPSGTGGCWYYFVGLHRLGSLEVRLGDPEGASVLAATRADGPGSMTRQTNAYSFALTATPMASPAP